MENAFQDPVFWVAVGFGAFVLLLIVMGLPKRLTGALDARAVAITKELDEARQLREEAQALLASYRKRQGEAEKEVQEIVTQARAEAERLAAETHKSLDALVARRTKLAQDKITQAEAQAVAEVRGLAADIAVGAAGRLIAERVGPEQAAQLVDASIRDLKGKMN